MANVTVYVFRAAAEQGKQAVSAQAYRFVKARIAAAAGLKADQLAILRGAHGKPYIEGSGMRFNVSHSGGRIAVALADAEVGVDIERIRPINPRVAERYFTAAENQYIALAGNSAETQRRFFEIWTAKEAYLKLYGVGLGGGLGFGTANENGPLAWIASDPFGGAQMRHMDFGYDTGGGEEKYHVAVCAEHMDDVRFYEL